MKYYAGIGSRQAPPNILKIMQDAGYALAKKGWTLRSGNATGSDQAFAVGANYVIREQVELYLPWPTFEANAILPGNKVFGNPAPWATAMAPEYVEHWARCSGPAKLFHARNLHQVMGYTYMKQSTQPSDWSQFIMCWTKDEEMVGGTATALKIAQAHNIMVLNLANEEVRATVVKKLGI